MSYESEDIAEIGEKPLDLADAVLCLKICADIQIFDNHIYKLRRIKHALGQQVHTSTIDNATLGRALRNADVVIGAVRLEKGNRLLVLIL